MGLVKSAAASDSPPVPSHRSLPSAAVLQHTATTAQTERWSFSFSGSGHSAFYMRDCTQARWDHFCIYRHTVCGNQHRGRFFQARFSAGDCSSWNTFLRQVKTIDGSFHISGADNSDSSHERNPHREMHRDCQRKLFHRAAQRRLSTGRSRNAFALHQRPANAHCDCRCCADTASGRT